MKLSTEDMKILPRNRAQKNAIPIPFHSKTPKKFGRRDLVCPGADSEAEDGADELASPTPPQKFSDRKILCIGYVWLALVGAAEGGRRR